MARPGRLCALSLLFAFALGFGSAVGSPRAASSVRSGCGRDAFRVVLDVGHTAEVPGAISARGTPEYAYNHSLTDAIRRRLIAAGFARTEMLVTGGASLSGLVRRVAQANGLKADLFLSIHHDSVPEHFLETWAYAGTQQRYSDRFKGHSLFVSSENGQPEASFRFAQLLGDELKARGLAYATHYTQAFMGGRRRDLLDAQAGVYRFDQLIVLRRTEMPAVLLEAGSIIHRDEELAMASPERQATIGAAVVQAVEAFCAARPAPPERRAGVTQGSTAR